MSDVTPIHRGWKQTLVELIASAHSELVVAAPYITADGLATLAQNVRREVLANGRLDIITDLSPVHVCDGSLDADALTEFSGAHERSTLWHVPALHLKVYIADDDRALVTSGNLTASAFYCNTEYGIEVREREIVKKIKRDLSEIRTLGTAVGAAEMRQYAHAASVVRDALSRQRRGSDPLVKQAFDDAIDSARVALIRLRLSAGPMQTVFAKTVLILLGRHGPLPTTEIHTLVQRVHPDLCDDSVDRVIDGRRFGKKWKHAVRSAQQHLKKQGLIQFDGRVWALCSNTEEEK